MLFHQRILMPHGVAAMERSIFNRLIDEQTDDRQIDRQTAGQTNRQTDGWMVSQSDRQMDRWLNG